MTPAPPPVTDADTDDDPPLPCAQALIAGTLALMTTWADPAPGSALDVAGLRSLLARKVVSNLFFLAQHPALPPAMRQVMAQARGRWQGLTHADPCPAPRCPGAAGIDADRLHMPAPPTPPAGPVPAHAPPVPPRTRWH